jgi:hypothetical protein
MDITAIDLDTLNARAFELLDPHCLRQDYPVVRHGLIDIGVKTGRESLGGDDCDALGVARPEAALNAAAEQLATEFGLKCKGFEACEKGWGSYYFAAP